jgi:hypothetical protein
MDIIYLDRPINLRVETRTVENVSYAVSFHVKHIATTHPLNILITNDNYMC